MRCRISIDGREISAVAGSNLLWVALDNGFYIPNLCAIREEAQPSASCRLCFVEVEGTDKPVTACTEKTFDGMSVRLQSPRIHRLRQTSFELLLSRHPANCGKCDANRRCELQNIAHREGFKINSRRFNNNAMKLEVDNSHHLITFDANKCVLCGRCVWHCRREGAAVLDFSYRGIDTMVSTFGGTPLSSTGCSSCLACAKSCPVGALYVKSILPAVRAN